MRGAFIMVAGLAIFALLSSGGGAPARADGPAELPRLRLDPGSVTVSGLSSGGYMAVQMHVIHSSRIDGAAIFAGGPFGCARGGTEIATFSEAVARCVNLNSFSWIPGVGGTWLEAPEVAPLQAGARRLAADGRIDPLEGLAGDRVYLFSGTEDRTVPQPVMAALQDWYAGVGAAITAAFSVAAGHAMVTTDSGNACAETASPHINDCDHHGARAALEAVYGPLAPAVADAAEAGRTVTFDQRAFVPADAPDYDGLHRHGHAYIPDQCASGATTCRLHVVFHGCQQNEDVIGDVYWTLTGYNAIAAANDIVVLYPQTKASEASLFNPWGMPNPKGCWDWWGFTGQDYLTREGVQPRAVWGMIRRLLGETNRPPEG